MRSAIIVVLAVLVAAPVAYGEIARSGSFEVDLEGFVERAPGFTSDPHMSRANALTNPGFETGGLPPWVTSGWTVTGAEFHSGSFSAEATNNFWMQQDICPVDVTLVNSVSLWSKQPQTIFQAVSFYYGPTDYDEFLIYPGAQWLFFDLTSQLRTSGVLTAIRIWGMFSSDPEPDLTWTDDVVIDTPTGPSAVEASTWGKVKMLYY